VFKGSQQMSTATESPSTTQSPDAGMTFRRAPPLWRRILSRRVVFVCIALDVNILAALAYWHGAHAVGRAATNLVVAPGALDFGEVWACKEFAWQLPIHNPTSRDIEVTDMSATCGCATISPKQFVVPVGGTVSVHLTLDLISRSPRDKTKTLHNFSATIFAITSDEVRRPLAWELSGRVREPFTISRPDGDSDDPPLIAGGRFAPRRIRVSLCEGIASVTAEADPNHATVQLQRDGPNARDATLVLTPNQALAVGSHQVSISLTPVLPDNSRLPKIPIDLRVNVFNDVEASPAVVSWGSLPVGAHVAETVILHSRTGRPFTVRGVTCDDPALRIAPLKSARSSAAYRIELAVSSQGGYDRAVRILVDQSPRREPYAVTVRIVGQGVSQGGL
jgi:hypothetical protein